MSRVFSWIPASFLMAGVLFLGACSSDSTLLKRSRESFLREDYQVSEKLLVSQDVTKHSENQFLQFASLASIAMARGEYQKAILFLNLSRELVLKLRSSPSGFSWFNRNYASNGIEYSYLHYFLVMANELLAEEGKTPPWNTPEIKDENGAVLVPAQTFPARVFSEKEISDYRQKADSELLSWDSHLQNLFRSETELKIYRNDLWARLLASFLHSRSETHRDQRTSELLAEEGMRILKKDFQQYPSSTHQGSALEKLAQKLRNRKGNARSTLFVLEAGVMSRYKIRRFHLGLSTLFKGIDDPFLRSQLEQLGMQFLLFYAPEFGLTLFSGALAGAITGSDPDDDVEYDGPPRQFTDAIDESFGFVIPFPSLELPPSDTEISLQLFGNQQNLGPYTLPIVSPLQEILSTELRERESRDMFKKALKIGAQYLAILIPAIKTYQAAEQEGNLIKRLATIAGYYLAKKIIDQSNRPDVRSWNFLPQLIAADALSVPPGSYRASVTIRNGAGSTIRDLGEIPFGNPGQFLIYRRIGDVPILRSSSKTSLINP